MCHTEVDEQYCEYCGSPSVEVEDIYSLKLQYTCSICHAHKITSVDHDEPNSLRFGHTEMKKCPNCHGKWTMHTIGLLSIKEKPNYEKILSKSFSEELRKDTHGS